MSNNYDNPIILDSAGAAGDYFGFGRASGGSVSTKARIYSAANLAAVNTVLTAPRGSIALCDDGTIAQNTNGATAWSQVGVTLQAIADPGNAGAIPVTASGYVEIVSAGAETRTIAAPTFAGQRLALYFKTDGGDVTITIATTINQTGNNTAVTADAGDMLILEAVSQGANFRWRVVANDGFSLSTV